jgi:peptide-methionine (S)-S-oxide reductase
MERKTEVATLGGGCFWCLEAAFAQVEGVKEARPGYAGGASPNPTYDEVCTGRTGHAEVVQLRFDPSVVSYRELLEIFFALHDPSTRDRQGADVGSQYRSVIFYHSPEQARVAEDVIRELEASGTWSAPVVTEREPSGKFWPAEEYHRDYFRRNPEAGYCRLVITPKLEKLRRRFPSKLPSP